MCKSSTGQYWLLLALMATSCCNTRPVFSIPKLVLCGQISGGSRMVELGAWFWAYIENVVMHSIGWLCKIELHVGQIVSLRPPVPRPTNGKQMAMHPSATHNAMHLCGGASIRQCTPAFLPHNLDTPGKRQCNPNNMQCTTVVSSRKPSRPRRVLAPSCPSTWTWQASANAQ